MRHYELVTILSPMLNQDEASAKWDEIKSFIANRDGEITSEQIWGTRRLAYPIRKGNYNFLEGSYHLSTFTVDNSFNRELENYLRLDEQVLRSLIVNCDGPLPDKPPPGPLTAPSRYIPPGRGRRQDGGGPIPEGQGVVSAIAGRAVLRPEELPARRRLLRQRERRLLADQRPCRHLPTLRPLPRRKNASADAVATPEPAAAPEPAATPEPAASAEPTTEAEAAPEPAPETDGGSAGVSSREQDHHHRQPWARSGDAVLHVRQSHDVVQRGDQSAVHRQRRAARAD